MWFEVVLYLHTTYRKTRNLWRSAIAPDYAGQSIDIDWQRPLLEGLRHTFKTWDDTRVNYNDSRISRAQGRRTWQTGRLYLSSWICRVVKEKAHVLKPCNKTLFESYFTIWRVLNLRDFVRLQLSSLLHFRRQPIISRNPITSTAPPEHADTSAINLCSLPLHYHYTLFSHPNPLPWVSVPHLPFPPLRSLQKLWASNIRMYDSVHTGSWFMLYSDSILRLQTLLGVRSRYRIHVFSVPPMHNDSRWICNSDMEGFRRGYTTGGTYRSRYG